MQTLKINGWTFCDVDIIDEDGNVNFQVNGGFHLKEVAMDSHLTNYDSLVVLTHFKGHAMGGFGGSLKNIAIGCASGKVGKRQVHGLQDYGSWVRVKVFMVLMADIGILASTDILAIDQACIDLVYSAPDSKDLKERIFKRKN